MLVLVLSKLGKSLILCFLQGGCFFRKRAIHLSIHRHHPMEPGGFSTPKVESLILFMSSLALNPTCGSF